MRHFLHELGAEYFPGLCELKIAAKQQTEEEIAPVWTIFEAERYQCVTLRQLAVDGRDLIGAGAQTGKKLGDALNHLLKVVLDQPEMNERERLLAYFRENWKA